MRKGCSSVVAVALGTWLASSALAKPPAFQNPPSISSENGVLALTLSATPSEVTIRNKTVVSNVYNGTYVPAVLRVNQGDTIQIQHENNTAQLQINLHTHGLITSPLNNGDNVLLTVSPGATFDNSIYVAPENSSGMYWWHTHVHGYVNSGIANGLAGAILVGNVLENFPALAGITENVLILKDMKIQKGEANLDPDPAGKTIRTINGQYQPVISIAPGELQLWRIANQSANIFYDLTMKGVTFNVLAVDGNIQNQLTEADELLLPPGRRFEVLVRGPTKPGKYKLKTAKFQTGPEGDAYPGQTMATLDVSKTPVQSPIPLPTTGFPVLEDLSDDPIDVQRTVVFADTPDPNLFTINGKPYNPDVIGTTVQLGDLEQWTIQNTSGEFHVFHIHQGDFQVVSIDGVPQPFTGYQDVVNLPDGTEASPGEVVILIRFDPPIIVGEYVYHCHIVQHEDQGMMANVVVEDAIATLMRSTAPPDPIAEATTPAPDDYWCK
jgi:FtsP/CotA-like multicopper oxidase with cupredoxin domain